MSTYTESIEKLIERLIKLPGVGRRSAERIVNYILDASKREIKLLVDSISAVKENVQICQECHNLSEGELCKICKDERRKKNIICVVEKSNDVIAIEKGGYFDGVYHVLMGAIAPLEGKGPGDLKIDSLINRIRKNNITEVIIATDADTEGETTALYLNKLIKPLGVKLTRIGLGLPVGSNLEYADSATLTKAMQSRQEI